MEYHDSRYTKSEEVHFRVKQMLIENNAPGKDVINSANTFKDLKEWYLKFGEAYEIAIKG